MKWDGMNAAVASLVLLGIGAIGFVVYVWWDARRMGRAYGPFRKWRSKRSQAAKTDIYNIGRGRADWRWWRDLPPFTPPDIVRVPRAG